MPWGYECRQKLIKQKTLKPTERRGEVSAAKSTPGPNHYEPPKIYGGDGYSKIKRAPAYTFGYKTKLPIDKPSVSPNAPMFNVRDISKRGLYRIPGGLMIPQIEAPDANQRVPGPGTYNPRLKMQIKRVPAYSMRPAAKPPYQSMDEWTPPPNMYCPPIPKPVAPSYTLGYNDRILTKAYIPGPGEHNPKFDIVQKNKPAYSFGSRYKPVMPIKTPSPNAYCEKKFLINKASSPAPSFGIRHSPFLGKEAEYLKTSKIDLQIMQV